VRVIVGRYAVGAKDACWQSVSAKRRKDTDWSELEARIALALTRMQRRHFHGRNVNR